MLLASLLSLILVAASPAVSAKSSKEKPSEPRKRGAQVWDRTFPIERRALVRVRCDDARVRVHGTDEKTVRAHVVQKSRIHGIFVGGVEPRVEFRQEGDEVEIDVLERGNVSGIVLSFDEGFEVDVWVPHEADVDVTTDDGHVQLEDLSGHVTASTEDGRIEAESVRGDVTFHSSDGPIRANDLEGSLDARTSDGRIEASGRFDNLVLRSRDGTIEADARPGSRLKNPWFVETTDGRVELRIPVQLNAMLDARTRDGRIRVDLPIARARRDDRETFIGQLNAGGPLLVVRTGEGSITLGTSR